MAVKGLAKGVDTPTLLNTIRANLNSDYQNRVPIATQENITEVGSAILEYESTTNDFLHALVNRVAMVLVQSRLYENPLREFKKGTLEYGTDIEEVFVNIAQAQAFDPAIAEREVFKRVIPDVEAIFHRLNRKDFYKVTINMDQLRAAFLGGRGVDDLIARIVDSLYSGDNYDEYLIMKQLLINYIEKGLMYPIQVAPITDEASAKAFTIQMRAMSTTLGFMSGKYNAQGVLTFTRPEDLIIFLTPQAQALIDVEALAAAFNLTYAQFLNRIVIVDNFGSLENVQAVMVDKNFFVVYDNLFKFTENYNGQGLYWNYFFHHWQIMSSSQFSNAIVFTTEESTVTGITIDPTEANLTKSSGKKFTASVTTTGMGSKAVAYNLIGGITSSETTITSEGFLYIGKDETATTLTVRALSIQDTSKTADATVTITA